MRKGSELLVGAVKAASYKMMLQLMMRIISFTLNAFLIRHVTKDLFGVFYVRLQLLYGTSLSLVNSPFESAAQSKTERRDWQQTINLVWLHFPFSVLCNTVLATIWYFAFERPNPDVVPFYGIGVICIAVSSLLDTLARPCYMTALLCQFFKLKVAVLAISELIESIVLIILLIVFPKLGLINFVVAELSGSLAYTVSYYSYFAVYIKKRKHGEDIFPFKTIMDFFPRKIKNKTFVDWNTLSLTWSFFKQAILKQLLTEGEKYAMTVFSILSFADQGVYDVVNNLGSTAARFIFFPIEESGYIFFSQSLTRGVPFEKQSKESINLATQVLKNLLSLVTLIGAIILAFGYGYAYLALDIYGGTVLSTGSGPLLLKWYCVYVLIIAVNGPTECFVFAAMSKDEVDRYNQKMLVFSAVFLISSLILTNIFGSVGFILANCLNVLSRILHSVYFIIKYFRKSDVKPLSGITPSKMVLAILIASCLITTFSEVVFCCDMGWPRRLFHIFIGSCCFLTTLATIYFKESDLIMFVSTHILYRKKAE